jgi:tungstate transport system substrate-binding protein
MYNDFVLVGPASSKLQLDKDIVKALQTVAESRSTFISRGDNSGTHKKELSLWKAAGISPEGKWYREVGQGMGKVLQMAGELDAYTLTDRGTWLAYMDKSPLKILSQGDPKLYNPYHIIAVSPERYPDINYQGAKALTAWITSATGQSLIGKFAISDTLLFTPSANAKQVAGQDSGP